MPDSTLKAPHHGGRAYRADIDGLRAIAVVSVILYHGRVPGFSGGFVGVDVFFVISGFLISSIVFRQLDRGTFSLANFYERRIRRIVPALTLVLIACTAAALTLLLATDLDRFCNSLAATLVFLSNAYFWRTAGYFDTAAGLKPLLHTWSLAIEEQFYLVFPLTAVLVTRYLPRSRTRIFFAALLLSLALCVAVTRLSPDTAFYLPVTRAWELLVGVMLACGMVGAVPARARTAIAAVGLGAIVLAVLRFGPGTSFPGAAALLPTLGTALVIAAGRDDDPIAGRILSNPVSVLIGRMSYSLYLWHWPTFVFFRYAARREPHPGELAILLVVIFCVSAASWRFVEEPFRRIHGGIPYRRVLRTLAVASTALMAFALVGWVSGGYSFLQSAEVNGYLAGEADRNPDRERCFDDGFALLDRGASCRLGVTATDSPGFVVWGDSHADALMPLIGSMATEQRISGIFAAASSCVPLLGVHMDRRDGCARLGDSVVALVRRRRIHDVILVAYWSVYTDGWELPPVPPGPFLTSRAPGDTGSSRLVFSRALSRTIDTLLAAGARVWIIEQVPSQPFNVPRWLATTAKRGGDPSHLGRPVAEHQARQRFVAAVFARVANGRTVITVDPAAALCDARLCPASAGGRSLYADNNHLSTFGATHLRNLLRPMFAAIARPSP